MTDWAAELLTVDERPVPATVPVVNYYLPKLLTRIEVFDCF